MIDHFCHMLTVNKLSSSMSTLVWDSRVQSRGCFDQKAYGKLAQNQDKRLLKQKCTINMFGLIQDKKRLLFPCPRSFKGESLYRIYQYLKLLFQPSDIYFFIQKIKLASMNRNILSLSTTKEIISIQRLKVISALSQNQIARFLSKINIGRMNQNQLNTLQMAANFLDVDIQGQLKLRIKVKNQINRRRPNIHYQEQQIQENIKNNRKKEANFRSNVLTLGLLGIVGLAGVLMTFLKNQFTSDGKNIPVNDEDQIYAWTFGVVTFIVTGLFCWHVKPELAKVNEIGESQMMQDVKKQPNVQNLVQKIRDIMTLPKKDKFIYIDGLAIPTLDLSQLEHLENQLKELPKQNIEGLKQILLESIALFKAQKIKKMKTQKQERQYRTQIEQQIKDKKVKLVGAFFVILGSVYQLLKAQYTTSGIDTGPVFRDYITAAVIFVAQLLFTAIYYDFVLDELVQQLKSVKKHK